jgi:hypothetical protein
MLNLRPLDLIATVVASRTQNKEEFVRRFLIATALVLLPGCASDAPSNMPKEIATSWCGQYRPGSPACLRTAVENHVHCLTADPAATYHQCRSDLLTERQAAEYR